MNKVFSLFVHAPPLFWARKIKVVLACTQTLFYFPFRRGSVNSLKSFCIGSVVVQFYPWFIFDFPLFGGYYWKVIF